MKKGNTNKINIITLGCSKNRVDSEVLISQLRHKNYDVEHENANSKAPCVIINTCGFIHDAKEESINTILEYVDLKREGIIDRIYVFGCLAHRYKTDLTNELPEVDGFFGFADMDALLREFDAVYDINLVERKAITTPSHYSYFKISEGCNRRCSFCAIPHIRGNQISRSIESLLNESRYLSSRGVKELLVIAQDVTAYGTDLYGKQEITKLIRGVSDEQLFEWIRLHYTFPASFPIELLQLMTERQDICNYIDIPLQHINDKILKSMRRGAGRDETLRLVDNFKSIVPNAAIRTSFIVGYPGETDNDFQELIDFITKYRFDRVGAFQYSHEEGTYAGTLIDDVPEKVKQERYDVLMEVQQDIAFAKNQEKVGRTMKVVIDAKEGNTYIGRSEYDSPEVDNEVIINSNEELEIGSFHDINIEEADFYDLTGKLMV